jgi:hypothetical protein
LREMLRTLLEEMREAFRVSYDHVAHSSLTKPIDAPIGHKRVREAHDPSARVFVYRCRTTIAPSVLPVRHAARGTNAPAFGPAPATRSAVTASHASRLLSHPRYHKVERLSREEAMVCAAVLVLLRVVPQYKYQLPSRCPIGAVKRILTAVVVS